MQAQFEVQIVSSVTAVDRASWDRLAGTRPFASYDWYQFGEQVLVGDEPVYIILNYDGKPVARATFWFTRQEPVPAGSKLVRRVLEGALRRWPLFVCRSPISNANGLILPDSPLRDAAVRIITGTALRLGRERKASFVVFDYLTREHEDITWPNSFMTMDGLDPGTYLELEWPDFDSYVAAQKKSMRKDYRRHMNRAADLGIHIHFQDSPPPVDDALPLIRAVEAHHGSSPNPQAQRVFELKVTVPATWITATIGERMVGCGLLLGDGPNRFLTALGLDYEVRYVYFQLVYAAIDRAISEGTRRLRGGSGAYETKQRLGFKIEGDNHLVFTVKNPALRWLAQRVISQSPPVTTENEEPA
ncbi:MAG: hypothetical protein GYB65_20365 [Chloroflexi bacterium]|nr:hypothetical protein [Chloroflexota bacterium]